jgi:dipeptidyl aminopeptidase/acylaminoacyl peptidase
MDVSRGVTSRVTASPGDERDPVWSPDGRSLAFIARRDDGAALRRKGLRASDPETVMTDSPEEDIPESWSRDGQRLLFVRRTPQTGAAPEVKSVWALPLEGGGAPEPILKAGFNVDEPQLSPDGRWLAYVSWESGRAEVYVEPFRRDGERVRVSVDGGGQPKWRGDAKELFYTAPPQSLMSVTVRVGGDRPEVSLPTQLFEIRGLQGPDFDDYAPSADGQRFLVKMPVGEDRQPRLYVVTNWTSLLR